MDTEELQFTLASILSKGQSYLCLLKEKWGGGKLELILSWAKILRSVTFITERWNLMKDQGHGAGL